MPIFLCLLLAVLAFRSPLAAQELPDGVTLQRGRLNSVVIEKGGHRVIVYGAEQGTATADTVLMTHMRRDATEFARSAASEDGKVTTPKGVAGFLANPSAHWDAWWDDRFDYYMQQVTRLPVVALSNAHDVFGSDMIIGKQGVAISILETPGHTREGVTYLTEIGGKTIAFSGDLILAGGRVPDLYSFQEAIPEAKIGGYHGYGGRLGQLINSLEKLAAAKPDIIIPLHGEPIFDVQKDIGILIDRMRKIYANYLSTNALNWYFKEERLTIAGRRVLGADAEVELMDYSEHVDLPDWCKHLGTTKLLLADDGSGFALDVGGQRAFEDLKKAIADGIMTRIDGIFVTHTHNDHTAAVAEAAREFSCPVYAVAEVADVLENPGAWFLPGISPNAVDEVTVMADGEVLEWKNFKLTAQFFPGQMWNHGALLAERKDHAPVLFMGDSFSPSGIDDYCLMNRNLMREDSGFFLCFKKVRELPEGAWMVNQHIPHLFRFSDERLDLLEKRYAERRDLIAELTPWDDANFAIDERWASFYPYGQELAAGTTGQLELRLWNHSQRQRQFSFTLNLPEGMSSEVVTKSVKIAARERGSVIFDFEVAADASTGVKVITADLASDGFELSQWAEALVKVGEE